MRKYCSAFFLVGMFMAFSGCEDNSSVTPEFNDNGLTIKKLQAHYNCKDIEFENWEEDDAKDSSLTVCLINSSAPPPFSPEEGQKQLKFIAAQVKKALVRPANYNAYYIIFVTESGEGLLKNKAHTFGGEIPSAAL